MNRALIGMEMTFKITYIRSNDRQNKKGQAGRQVADVVRDCLVDLANLSGLKADWCTVKVGESSLQTFAQQI